MSIGYHFVQNVYVGEIMLYDFSDSLNAQDVILEDFIDNHTTYFVMNEDGVDATVLEHYREIFTHFHTAFESEKMIALFDALAAYKITQEIPYVIVSNEIHSLSHLFISSINREGKSEHIVQLLGLFKAIDNSVAQLYLARYIDALVSLNTIRRNSLADLVEKNIIAHYESHLLWLSKLALRIKEESVKDFPELNHCMCDFGKWLEGDAKKLIQNNSKYLALESIHKNLHMLAYKIYKVLEAKEYHILINYLEKCELMSLGIGTELALIDNIIINQKVAKDSLTGALNRQGLRTIFRNQYELALATGNSFILTICDLDYFKALNDTHGHVAGDRMLQLFVEVVKRNIRNSDVIVRYGGEEFVIMLPSIHQDKGIKVIEKMREDFAQSVLAFNGEKIQATVSIGMMEVTPHHPFQQGFIDDYIMQVDQKLYYAKEHGRNRVAF